MAKATLRTQLPKTIRFRILALMTRKPIILLVLLPLLALLTACGPQVGGEGAFLNLAPDVEYTGRESCQSCHQKIYDSYLESGMGRSFYRPVESEAIERFGPEETVYDAPSDLWYFPYWKAGEFFVMEYRLGRPPAAPDTLHKRTERVDYIVGSGHQTRSYILERGDFFYEVPITWYVGKQKWDLSPGYENGHNSRFDREIGEECVACHTGHIDFVEGTTNQFKAVSLGIDCEKCHGPGQLHINRMEQDLIVDVGDGEIDYSIVNPKHLSPRERFNVCQQCHLQGINVLTGGSSVNDYRPGLELSQTYQIFIPEQVGGSENAFGIASHAERMMASQCFIVSENMNCVTCHDPHKSIGAMDTMVYVNKCQSCHSGSVECGAPDSLQMAMSGNCITCHMPKGGTSDIPHVTFTDHKIRVVKDEPLNVEAVKGYLDLVCHTDSNPSEEEIGKAWLLHFEREDSKPEYLDKAHSLLGEFDYYERASALFYQGRLQDALIQINLAVAAKPSNTWYLYRKAEILEKQGRVQEALGEYQKAWDYNPALVEAGLKVANLTLNTATPANRESALANAKVIYERLRVQKPFDERILTNLGFAELNSGNYTVAKDLFLESLALNPDYELAKTNLELLETVIGSN